MNSINLPGFTASVTGTVYQSYLHLSNEHAKNTQKIVPQFWTGKSFACIGLAIAIASGEFWLAPVAARVCAYAATTGGGVPHHRICDPAWLDACKASGYDSETCWKNCPPVDLHPLPPRKKRPEKG